MAKKKTKKNPIQKVKPQEDSLLAEMPDFMGDVRDTGTEELGQYLYVQRLKIIQNNSKDELLEEFNSGDVIIAPDNILLRAFDKDEPTSIFITTTFFFNEFIKWNQRKELPMILDRTTDENSDLARLCRNAKTRTEVAEDGRKLSNREHLNWICFIHDEDQVNPVILSFSKGGFRYGRDFANLIKHRKTGAPLYGMRFEINVEKHQNKDGDTWWGFEVTNPSDGEPWVTNPEEYAFFKESFEELKKRHEQREVRVDFSGDGDEEAEVNATVVDDDGEF